MARQEQQRRSERDAEEPLPPLPGPAGTQARAQAHSQELDDLLGEIDSVLETNAETFVKGFVQKGGQ